MNLKELYQEIILDHGKNPHNLKKIKSFNKDAKGHNPLCGDKVHVYLKLDDKKNIEDISYGELPNKYEAGTMATAQVVAFDQSIKFLEKIGIENIIKHEKELMDYGKQVLKKNNSVKLIGNPKEKGAVLSFTIEGVHPHDIATILDEDGVAIRAGHHCCQILHEKLGLSATARASFGVYNNKNDIDQLNSSINKCKKIFNLK